MTAKKKGAANVQVRDGEDLKLIETIDIHVNNQAPTRNAKEHMVLEPLTAVPAPAGYEPPDDADGIGNVLYSFILPFGDYFSDKDKDPLKYTAKSSAPRNAVVAAINGNTVLVDLLNNVGDKVAFEFTATDDDPDDPKESVGTLSVEVQLSPVLSHTYTVFQFAQSGTHNFASPVEVGFRQGADHILRFSDGFGFTAAVDTMAGGSVPTTTTEICQIADAIPAIGDSCYVITKSGSVTLGALDTTTSANYDLPFKVTGPTVHSITVAYKRWEMNAATQPELTLYEDSRTLQLRVNPVSE